MALVVADRVKEVTTTTGTGAISLGGAQANFVTFSSALSNGDTTYYAIVDNDNVAYEVGLGTYASSGNTLTRTTVLDSSNSGSAVSFGAGQKDVFVTYPADKSVYLDASGKIGSFTSTGIDDNATETAITIDADERVGINVGTIVRTLDVKAKNGAQIISSFETTSGISGRIGVSDANTTADSSVGIGSTGNNLDLYAGAAARATLSSFGDLSVTGGLTVDTNTLVVDSTNNRVGIGVSDPDSLLEISTSDGDTAPYFHGGGSLGLRIADSTITNAGDRTEFLKPVSSGMFSFKNGLKELLTIKASGRIGSDEINPQDRIHIKGSLPALRLENTAGAADSYTRIASIDGAVRIQADQGNSTANSFMAFDVDTVERARIDSDGNVLIGAVSSPKGRLHVSDNTDIDMDINAKGQLHIDGVGYGFGVALNADGAQLYTNSANRDLIFGVNETEVARLTPTSATFSGTVTTPMVMHPTLNGIGFGGASAASSAISPVNSDGTWQGASPTSDVGNAAGPWRNATFSGTVNLGSTVVGGGAGGGEFGSVYVDAGSTGGYEGYSIGGRIVFMHNNDLVSGLYNDVNNQWILQNSRNSETGLYHAGVKKGYTYASGWRVTGNMLATSNVYAYYSDERLKEVVGAIEEPLESVKAIRTFYYTHNDKARELGYEGSERQVGVSAQSVQAVMPEVIGRAPIDDDGEGGSVTGEDYMTVQYERLVPLLIESIKTLTDKVQDLQEQINAIQ